MTGTVIAQPRAASLGLIGCDACGLVLRAPSAPQHASACPRCGSALHRRRPNAVNRAWAYLIAAVILYIPANVLPVLRSTKLFDTSIDTIISGVVSLWDDGSWDLAVIVFTASVVVPVLKIGALALLLLSVQNGWQTAPRERARLYRILEFIGHWSMLDVFAIALLVTLVHFGAFAYVEPGPGIVAFGAVVVLTMLATMSFDPRLIWDALEVPAPASDAGAATASPPLPAPPALTEDLPT